MNFGAQKRLSLCASEDLKKFIDKKLFKDQNCTEVMESQKCSDDYCNKLESDEDLFGNHI